MPDQEDLRAGIYLRLSQHRERDDDGNSVPAEQMVRHERECRDLAAERGWCVTKVYPDSDRSAFSGRTRENWELMLRDLSTGKIQAVVAHHADRLYRNYADLERLLKIGDFPIATVMSVVTTEAAASCHLRST